MAMIVDADLRSLDRKLARLRRTLSEPERCVLDYIRAAAVRIDQFLSTRGYVAAQAAATPPSSHTPPVKSSGPEPAGVEKAVDFVCEEDVRQALRQGRKIVIGERSIVTPAARDLGEQHRLFVQAAWRP